MTDKRGSLADPAHPQAWEKVLWRKQPFSDNYVPLSFLSELDTLREYLASFVGANAQHLALDQVCLL